MANITYGTNIQFGTADPVVAPTVGQDVMFINNTSGEMWYFNTLGNAWECVTCGASVSAINGLTYTAPDVLLGGILDRNTTVVGASTFDMTWSGIRSYSMSTGRTPVASNTSLTLGSTSVQGLISTHTDLVGLLQNSNFSLNHTNANVWDQRNGNTDSASITQYGTSTNAPVVEISAISTSSTAKILQVTKNGYFFSNVAAVGAQTDVLYYDSGTGQILFGPGGGGAADNWGTQVAVVSARLTGNGVTALDIAQQGATTNQVLTWNGATWVPQTGLWQYGTSVNDIWQVPTGNVGIDTAVPTEKLHVLGNVFGDRFIGYGLNRATSSNSAVGRSSLAAVTSGANNTATGFSTLSALTTGGSNTANGSNALTANITGSNNVAVGYQALSSTTDAIETTAIGVSALGALTTGTGQTAVGYNALAATTTSTNNTAVGHSALATNGAIGSNNTGVGFRANRLNVNGSNNTAIGSNALAANLTQNCTAVGSNALTANTTGLTNTAVGFNSLTANTSGLNNCALGALALSANTTASFNTAMGANALQNNVTGTNNTAVGRAAGQGVTGSSNTCIGATAMNTATGAGGNNVAIGVQALNVHTGADCVAIGNQALFANTANTNVAIGRQALTANTTGVQNVGIGTSSIVTNTTGSRNVGVGTSTMRLNVVGTDNTALGDSALDKATTSNNTAVGSLSLSNLTTGNQSTAIGYGSLSGVTTGSANIAIGFSSGGLTSTGSSNIFIGSSANASANNANNEINIGNTFYKVGNFTGVFTQAPTHEFSVNGNASKTGGGTWAVFSDSRIKENVIDLEYGLEEIKQVRPVKFEYIGDLGNKVYSGIVAQELELIMPSAIYTIEKDGFVDMRVHDGGSTILYALVNAVKEIDNKIENQGYFKQSRRTVTLNTSVLDSDYLLYMANLVPVTITLPNATLYPDRIISIIRGIPNNIGVNLVSSGGLIQNSSGILSASASLGNFNTPSKHFILQSDGVNWLKIN